MVGSKLKRLFGLLLTITLVLSFVGCGQKVNKEGVQSQSANSSAEVVGGESSEESVTDEPKEPVTLEWYYRGNGIQKDTQAVEDRVNELLKNIKGLEHVTVHMNCFISSDYANQVLLAQTSGTQMDIINTVGLSWLDEIKNETFRTIDDYLMNDYSAVHSEIPEWLWESMQVEGKTYIVPNLQQGSNKLYLTFPSEYAQYVDLDKLRKLTADSTDIQALCDGLYESYGAITNKIGIDGRYIIPLSYSYSSSKYSVGGNKDFIYDAFGVKEGSTEVVNFMMTDEFKALASKAAEWFAQGLITADILLTGDANYTKSNMINGNAFVMDFEQSYGDEETASAIIGASLGFDVVALPLNGDYYFMGNGWGAGGNGITSSSEHPEEAMKFLEVLNTKEGKEVYNTIVYGLEGTHYEKVNENRIKTLEYDATQGGNDTSYAGIKWIIGNTTNAYLNQACSDTLIEDIDIVNNDPTNVISPIMGFRFDESSVEIELSQCQAVYKEYYDTFRYGVTGNEFESKWNEYLTKMEAAGAQKVISEMQKQLDAWDK